MPTNKQKHGGTRQGSGAPLKYGEETVMICFRVPISKKDQVKQLVKDYLSQLEITTHHNSNNGKG
jgi:hypothetical protein